jgi:hypothetical protein
MSQSVEKLLSLAGEPLGPPLASAAGVDGQPLAGDLIDAILSRTNGFYAFESALHVFPLTGHPGTFGIDSWNDPGLWRDLYRGLADGFLFFAEDVFGGQFALKDDRICSFDPETGESTQIAKSLDEWARALLDDFEVMTGHPIAHQWQVANGPVRPGDRLIPKVPFVLGGDYSMSNLIVMDAARGMRFRAELAVQIRDLPDGTPVTFKIVD